MVSSRTANRARKLALLREVQDVVLDMMLMECRQRDLINMAEFKQLLSKIKGMKETAERGWKALPLPR